MSDLIAVISSAVITEEALRRFVLNAGGYGGTKIKGVYLAEGQAYIWINLDNGELPNIRLDAPEAYQQMIEKLGGEAQTCIIIDIGNPREQSHKLALEFALACAQTWPCVVNRMHKDFHSYSKEELLRMREEGRTFFGM
jgi:hypothetical protein